MGRNDGLGALFAAFQGATPSTTGVAPCSTGTAAAADISPVNCAGEDSTADNPTAARPGGVSPNDNVMNVKHIELESDENCLHGCVRRSSDAALRPPSVANKPPARTFPYKLDPFQTKSVCCMEAGESVLVSAHTSAGKTTVAEYAIAMALRDKQRVVYTSPIKALSNQKYRDLYERYKEEVGLLTGDVTLNADASVLVMTTEILKLMLYHGSPVTREVKWVIFDEVHYMRDRDRGVVWEECIILLPDAVRFVFLSATIPNAREFAEWICTIKNQPCHVISTDYRPVPLQHFIFPAGGKSIYLVMDEHKDFKEANFQLAMAELVLQTDPTAAAAAAAAKKRKVTDQASEIESLVRLCERQGLLPLIVFSFSKKEVERNSISIKDFNFTTEEERGMIDLIFQNAVSPLGDDKDLPQIGKALEMFKRGVGVHHGGLLPVVKEVAELLFHQQLIKILFTTETFAMGINMPARAVAFTTLKKWDGETRRRLLPGEYTQMSGRAGRRGLDDRGVVILLLSERLESEVARELFLGTPLRIDSQFRFSYNMLLNLSRTGAAAAAAAGPSPHVLLKKSLLHFQNVRALSGLQNKRASLERHLKNMTGPLVEVIRAVSAESSCDSSQNSLEDLKKSGVDIDAAVVDFATTKQQLRLLEAQIAATAYQPTIVAGFLFPGRAVRIAGGAGREASSSASHLSDEWGWGLVVSPLQTRADPSGDLATITLQILVECHPASIDVQAPWSCQQPRPLRQNLKADLGFAARADGVWEVVTQPLSSIVSISQIVTKVSADKIASAESRNAAGALLKRILLKFNYEPPLLVPKEHLRLPESHESKICALWRQRIELLERIKSNPLRALPILVLLYEKFLEKAALSKELREMDARIEVMRTATIEDDLRAMTRVLRRLEYVDHNGVPTMKGRVASEISAADELVVTELFFSANFSSWSKKLDLLAALLSCFTSDLRRSDAATEPPDSRLAEAYAELKRVATYIADNMQAAQVPSLDADAYVAQFSSDLMVLASQWSRGARYSELAIPENVFDGSVIRSLRRLDELFHQLEVASTALGDEGRATQFKRASDSLRRGIVFAASLYI